MRRVFVDEDDGGGVRHLMRGLVFILAGVAVACGPAPLSSARDDTDVEVDVDLDVDADTKSYVFASEVVSFKPGENAGFGQDKMPDVVLGSPMGRGDGAGSLDVVSLGKEGEIVLGFGEYGIVDGDGPDLIVFENPFLGFVETGFVAASEDGVTWHEWPCDPENAEDGWPGCAGVNPVYASANNDIDPTDPAAAGGDAFDLADIGLKKARFIRIRDSGFNSYEGNSGGFDLDAVVVIHAQALEQ